MPIIDITVISSPNIIDVPAGQPPVEIAVEVLPGIVEITAVLADGTAEAILAAIRSEYWAHVSEQNALISGGTTLVGMSDVEVTDIQDQDIILYDEATGKFRNHPLPAAVDTSAFATAAQGAEGSTAYSWGNHAAVGYITDYTVTLTDVAQYESQLTIDVSQIVGLTQFLPSSLLSDYGFDDNSAQWDAAYSWGNHAAAGYLTSYTVTEADVVAHQAALTIDYSQVTNAPTVGEGGGTEFDPVFLASPAGGISGTQITNWDAAFTWGNHASAGYALSSSLASVATTGAYADLSGKPTIPTNVSQLSNDAGYISGYTVTEADVTAHEAALTIMASQIPDLPSGGGGAPEDHDHSIADVTGLQDALDDKLDSSAAYTSSDFNTDFTGKSSTDLAEGTKLFFTDERAVNAIKADAAWAATNWNIAFGWGNHASAGYALSSALSTVATSGAYADLSGKPSIPTAVSQLANDTGYITGYTVTQGDVTAHQAALSIAQSQVTGLTDSLAGKQATLISGTNIKKINGVDILGSGDIEIVGSGGGSVALHFGMVAPDPELYAFWFNTTTGQLNVYYEDADSSQWVSTGIGPQGIQGEPGVDGDDGAPGSPGTTELSFSIPGELALVNGEARWYLAAPVTLSNVIATVGVAPTGASLIFDVNKNGSTIFTTQANRPTILAGEFVDLSSVPDVTTFEAGDYVTVDIDQIGSTLPGQHAVIRLVVV